MTQTGDKTLTKNKLARHWVHGLSHHKLYYIYKSMIARCYRPSQQRYNCYGNIGITVCNEWRQSFDSFYKWATKNGWCDGLSLDRIDNNGPYSPKNCRFITQRQQSNNTRRNVYVEAFGERKTRSEWARDNRCVVSGWTLFQRFIAGWEPEKAISQPARPIKRG